MVEHDIFTCLSSLSLAFMSLISASDTKCLVNLDFTFCICDGARWLCSVLIRKCKGSMGSSNLKVLCIIRWSGKNVKSGKKKKKHPMNKGHQDQKKKHEVNFGCRLGLESDFWRSWGSGIKTEQDIGRFIFHGNIFFPNFLDLFD